MAATPAHNTRPAVEIVTTWNGTETLPAHVPYVRMDATPSDTYSNFEKKLLEVFAEISERLGSILDEVRATRLGVEQLLNDGNPPANQNDLLEMSLAVRDQGQQALAEQELS